MPKRDVELPTIRELRNKFGLTELQARFCHEFFLQDFVQSHAAEAAGYSEPKESGYEVMQKDHVQEAIQYIREQNKEAKEHEATDILREWEAIAFADMGDYADWDGEKVTLKDSEDLDEHARRAIKKVKKGKHGMQVELHDKHKALTKLAKYHKVLEEPQELHFNLFQVFQQLPEEQRKKLAELPDEQLQEFLDEKAPKMIEARARET